jgi:hypothetical protein
MQTLWKTPEFITSIHHFMLGLETGEKNICSGQDVNINEILKVVSGREELSLTGKPLYCTVLEYWAR